MEGIFALLAFMCGSEAVGKYEGGKMTECGRPKVVRSGSLGVEGIFNCRKDKAKEKSRFLF